MTRVGLVRLTAALGGGAVWLDPASVKAIQASGLPGCSLVYHGEHGFANILGTPDDVHAELFAEPTLIVTEKEVAGDE